MTDHMGGGRSASLPFQGPRMSKSDPNASTMAQRIMQYQYALQLAAQAPNLYDMPLLHRQMMELIGIPNADKVVPSKTEALKAIKKWMKSREDEGIKLKAEEIKAITRLELTLLKTKSE